MPCGFQGAHCESPYYVRRGLMFLGFLLFHSIPEGPQEECAYIWPALSERHVSTWLRSWTWNVAGPAQAGCFARHVVSSSLNIPKKGMACWDLFCDPENKQYYADCKPQINILRDPFDLVSMTFYLVILGQLLSSYSQDTAACVWNHHSHL